MARIAGVELQDNWKVGYALTRIKGLGWALSAEVLEKSGVDTNKRVSDLTGDDQTKITVALDKFLTEGDLTRKVRTDVARLQAIGTYRGIRHSRGLPAHGQRTRSNARTKRGKRRTVGAFKKEVLAKMTAGGASGGATKK